MPNSSSNYREELMAELEAVPEEYLPLFLKVIQAFRESISLKPAAESFLQGWRETKQGQTFPVSTLWDGIDSE
jgi:hypothetical protein